MLPSVIGIFYPRAWENRIAASHPSLKIDRRKFFNALAFNFLLLQLLFLTLFCYLFGSLFQQTSRIHNLKVLWVDYDGGVVGDAVRDAYKSLQSHEFPTLVERPMAEYPTHRDLLKTTCSAKYWAALYLSADSSKNLNLTIHGLTGAYNKSNILSFIWNEARYPTVVDSAIAGNMAILSNTARSVYLSRHGTSALPLIPPNNTAALSAFINPWNLSSTNLQPTTQGTRTVYNSICIVLILIQDFFYLATVNGLYLRFKVFNKISPLRIILVRDAISSGFTMVGSLLLTSAIWLFKHGWDVSGKQFALNWVIVWLFAHVNFLAIDAFTIWLSPQFVPMTLIGWVILNVTSVLSPFGLSPPFYRWAYALPAHSAYEALTDDWSNGCNPHLHFALPILFAYEIIGLSLTTIGVYRRCHFAVIVEETEQKAIQSRVDAAVRVFRDACDTSSNKEKASNGVNQAQLQQTREEGEGKGRGRTEDIEELQSNIKKLQSRTAQLGDVGPSFRLLG